MAQILIIEDDELLRGVLAKALMTGGHEVMQAQDGQQGVEVVALSPVDLVITDLIMPGQEGVETILALRRDHPKLPVIAMSGGANNSKLYLNIAEKAGARRVLAKPFTPALLLQTVEDVLAEATSGHQP